MLTRRALLAAPTLLVTPASVTRAAIDLNVAAGRYRIDPSRTVTEFSVGQVGGKGISGQFTSLNGEIAIDPTDVRRSSVSVIIDTASVSTGDASTDNFIRGPSVFDTKKHPKAEFASRSVQQVSDRAATVQGRLTVRAISQRLALAVALEDLDAGREAVFTANTSFFRSLYGMDAGFPFYKNEVSLSIRAVCTKIG